MRDLSLKIYTKVQVLWETLKADDGQDLIEYALLAALIALGATLGMKSLATGINNMFDSVNTALTTA
jgi:pilus assembly protein Flp/PilA